MLARAAEAQVCVTAAKRFDGIKAKPATDDQKRDINLPLPQSPPVTHHMPKTGFLNCVLTWMRCKISHSVNKVGGQTFPRSFKVKFFRWGSLLVVFSFHALEMFALFPAFPHGAGLRKVGYGPFVSDKKETFLCGVLSRSEDIV